jgi:hypothetical protein
VESAPCAVCFSACNDGGKNFLLATEFSASQEFGAALIFLVFEPCRVGMLDGGVFLGV